MLYVSTLNVPIVATEGHAEAIDQPAGTWGPDYRQEPDLLKMRASGFTIACVAGQPAMKQKPAKPDRGNSRKRGNGIY